MTKITSDEMCDRIRMQDIVSSFILKSAAISNKVNEIIAGRDGNGDYNIVLTVNGVELDFEKTVELFYKDLQRNVKSFANQMIEEKASDIMYELQRKSKELVDWIEEKIQT